MSLSVPTLLAPGNLDGFPWLRGSLLLFVTTEDSAPLIRNAPMLKKLAERIEVRVEVLPRLGRGSKYDRASRCQSVALAHAVRFDGLCFLYADLIWGRGSLCSAAQRLAEGYEAVFAPGPPVLPEGFTSALREHASVRDESQRDGALDVPPRVLAEVALQHLHPAMRAYGWDRDGFNTCPAYVTWPVPGEGLLLHAFHLHPVLLRVQPANPYFFAPVVKSLDEEFVARAYPSADRVYCVADSDELLFVSLMDLDDMPLIALPPGQRPDAALLARWAERSAALLHREFFRHGYRLHPGDMDRARWDAVAGRARELAGEVLRRLAVPDSTLAAGDPEAWSARRERSHQTRRLRRRGALAPVHLQALHSRPWPTVFGNVKSRAVQRSPRLAPLLRLLGRAPGLRRLRDSIRGEGGVAQPPPVPSRLLIAELVRNAVGRPRPVPPPAQVPFPPREPGADA